MSDGPEPERPLRIGLVCPYDLGVPGGVRTQVFGLARGLLAAGHQVEVLAPQSLRAQHRRVVDGVPTVSTGRAVPVLANGSTARLGLGPRARRAARRWVTDGGFDVVQVHEPLPPGIGHAVLDACAELADRTRPAVVATVHVALAPAPAGRSRALRLAAGSLRRRLADVAVLTAVSDHARRTVVDHLGRDPVVVPNGLDTAAWRPDGLRLRVEDGPVVVVLGRVDEVRKGVAVALRAWPAVRAQFPTARLLVVGPVGRGRVRVLDGVSHVGTVSEADKVRLVTGADLLVAPHLGGESFGLVLVEAMAAGTPVVATALPAFRDVLAGAGLLVPPNDSAALATVMAAVLGDPVLAGRMASAGLDRAGDFDFPVVVARTVEVFRLAVGAPREVAALRIELNRALQDRAAAAHRLAAVAQLAGRDGAPALAEAARAAEQAFDVRVQNRLSALLRSWAAQGLLDPPVRVATERVRLVRGVLNDRLRREDGFDRPSGTVELDDGWVEERNAVAGPVLGAPVGAEGAAHLPSRR